MRLYCLNNSKGRKLYCNKGMFLCVLSSLMLSACMDNVTLPEFLTPSTNEVAQPSLENPGPYAPEPPKVRYFRVNSNKLLEAEGNWNLVEENRSYDPAKANLEARKKVDVKRRSKMEELSPHFSPDAKSGEDTKMRVLRVTKSGAESIDKEGFEVVETILVKPAQTISGSSNTPVIDKTMLADDGNVVKPPEIPARKRVRMAMVGSVVSQPIIMPDLVSGDAPIPEMKPQSNVVKKEKKSSQKNSSTAMNKAKAVAVRAGVHPGKTRLVVEVSEVTRYKVAIDEIRKVLRIKMDKTTWGIDPQGSVSGSPLLGTYIARETQDGGVLLEIRLKDVAEIIDTVMLRPNDKSLYRVVIDLK